jgi:hypothetical protein
MITDPSTRRRCRALLPILLACPVLLIYGCSTTNNGNCDAQGGSNPVTCTQSGVKASVSSAPAVRQSTPPSSAGIPRPSTIIPVLVPVNQQGWTLDWRQHVLIESQGIIVTAVGPQAGNGSNFDIQYVPDDGWHAGNNTGEMDNWPRTTPPGPASINGFIMAGAATSAPQGSIAHPGDTIDWINQDSNMIGYIDVTGLNASGVEVDMWVWSKS